MSEKEQKRKSKENRKRNKQLADVRTAIKHEQVINDIRNSIILSCVATSFFVLGLLVGMIV